MFLILRNFLDKILPASIKYSLVRKLPNIETFFSYTFRGIDKTWLKDDVFNKTYKLSIKRSLLDVRKAYVLYLCAKNAAKIDGVFAELGVYKGAGSRLMLEGSSKQKKILLFDTFEGLPDVNNQFDSNWNKGKLGEVDVNDIKSFLPEDNFEFHQGFFPASTKNVAEDIKIAFIHIDFDLFQSTIDALHYCYPKMSKSGIILVDDYGVLACQGVKKAVDDFFEDKPEMVIPNLNGQCMIIKS